MPVFQLFVVAVATTKKFCLENNIFKPINKLSIALTNPLLKDTFMHSYSKLRHVKMWWRDSIEVSEHKSKLATKLGHAL